MILSLSLQLSNLSRLRQELTGNNPNIFKADDVHIRNAEISGYKLLFFRKKLVQTFVCVTLSSMH